MKLRVAKLPSETWRECVARHGRRYGVETEVIECFDRAVAHGDSELKAAWSACYDWDVCELVKRVDDDESHQQ